MKKFLYIRKILLLLMMAAFVSANSQVYITGTVKDEKTGKALAGQEVFVFVNDSISVNPPLVTDRNGIFKDTLGSGYEVRAIFAYVFDCNNASKEYVIVDPGCVVLLNFEICTKPMNHIDCEALYHVEPDSLDIYKFQFINKSIEPDTGNIYSYTWDFGDGTFSNEENPMHIYDQSGVYTVCLTIEDDLGNCSDTFCAPLQVPYQGECHASYTYTQQGSNPFTYQFIDLSLGNYYTWEWDFGDGYTSNEPNPSHTFAGPGAYYVCLRIHDQTFTCDDTFCDTIYVEDVEPCVADYAFEIDVENPHKVYFNDLSSGYVDQWEWNFGDGNISYEQNPVHVFDETGTYIVCLKVSNSDTSLNCSDEICNNVEIQITVECEAEFTARADSTSSIRNLFYFTDASSGNITHWYWDFGDGNTSTEQNPTHEYQESGTYEVCLSISAMGNCTDTHCQTVQTLNYFDLGGLAFAGDYPINNPNPTGDTGIAFLYKKYPDNILMPIDTFTFYHGGYYWFINIIEGDYMLKIGLTEHSNRYKDFFPTYFSNQLDWQKTIELPLWDSNYYSANVHLMPTVDIPVGNGNISGNVYWCDTSTAASKMDNHLKNVQIIMADVNQTPLKFTYTDDEGKFSFNQVPVNDYIVYADIAGIYSGAELVDISNAGSSVDIQIEICKEEILEIAEAIDQTDVSLSIYPNPVEENLNVYLKTNNTQEMKLSIFNVLGMKISSHDLEPQPAGKQQIEVGSLRKGVYFYSLSLNTGDVLISGKFIKK